MFLYINLYNDVIKVWRNLQVSNLTKYRQIKTFFWKSGVFFRVDTLLKIITV